MCGPCVGRLTRDCHSWRESLVHICGIIIHQGEILGPICSSRGADAGGLFAILVRIWDDISVSGMIC